MTLVVWDADAALARATSIVDPLNLSIVEHRFGVDNLVESFRRALEAAAPLAEVESAVRSAGSDYPSIPTELASGTRSALVHGTPSHRRLTAGDLVHLEVGGTRPPGPVSPSGVPTP